MKGIHVELRAKPLEELRFHPIHTIENLHPRKPAIRVKNYHFQVQSVECLLPKTTLFLQDGPNHWRKAEQTEISAFSEGVLTALYALYVLNIPKGECIVQRDNARSYSVYHVRAVEDDSFHDEQQEEALTFGADLECLLQHKKTGRLVSASSFVNQAGQIGYDDAIALIGKQVVHPILELRPKSASSASELHAHLLTLYDKVERYLRANDLRAMTTGKGRFQVGGHLHVGHCFFSFARVRALDLFLGIPLALTDFGNPRERRKRFGRLGSVRPNAFSGFEYRVLASWYQIIPEFLPVLEWFGYIVEHADEFPVMAFTGEMLEAYYEHHLLLLQLVTSEMEELARKTLPQTDFIRYGQPFFQLIREKGDVL